MKIGDLVCPNKSPKNYGKPTRIGLVIGERHRAEGQGGPALQVQWLGKFARCLWEPKVYLEKVNENR